MRKIISLFLAISVALVTAFPAAAMAPAPPAARFSPPRGLGYFTDAYQGSGPKTVVLIQDLHINYSAQKHIADLLGFYDAKKLLPSVIGVEGAEGPIDASVLASVPDADLRNQTSEFFLRRGELTGAAEYAVQSGRPMLLYGIEKNDYYLRHRQLYKESFDKRDRAIGRLRRVEPILARLAKRRDDRERTQTVKEHLDLLRALLQQQIPETDVRRIASHLLEYLSMADGVLDLDSAQSAELEQAVRSAIDYYVLAFVREQPMIDRTLALPTQQDTAFLIAGGFHTKGLTALLRAQGISYVVITPQVDHTDATDQTLYTERLLDHHMTLGDAFSDGSPVPADPSAQALEATGYWLLRHPKGQRLAVGVLYGILARRVRKEMGDAPPQKIADEVERRLAGQPLIKLDSQALHDEIERVILAPRREAGFSTDPGLFAWIHGEDQSPEEFASREATGRWTRLARKIAGFFRKNWAEPADISMHRLLNIFKTVAAEIPANNGGLQRLKRGETPLQHVQGNYRDLAKGINVESVLGKVLGKVVDGQPITLSYGTTAATFVGRQRNSETFWAVLEGHEKSAVSLAYLVSKGAALRRDVGLIVEPPKPAVKMPDARLQVTEYLTAAVTRADLTAATRKLMAFTDATEPIQGDPVNSRFYLGVVNGKPRYALLPVRANTPVTFRPIRILENEPVAGAYFQFETPAKRSNLFRVVPREPYLETILSPERGYILDYVEALHNGGTKWFHERAVRQTDFKATGVRAKDGRNVLRIGYVNGRPIEFYSNLPTETQFHLKVEDPPAGQTGLRLVIRSEGGFVRSVELRTLARLTENPKPVSPPPPAAPAAPPKTTSEPPIQVEKFIPPAQTSEPGQKAKLIPPIRPGNGSPPARTAQPPAAEAPPEPPSEPPAEPPPAAPAPAPVRLIRNPAPDQRPTEVTEEEVSRLIQNELSDIMDENQLLSLSRRYSMAVGNLLWAMMGASHLPFGYDEQEFQKLFDRKLISLAEDKIADQTRTRKIRHAPVDFGEDGTPKLLDTITLTPEDMAVMGTIVEKKLKEMDDRKLVNQAQLVIARDQARIFFHNMERNLVYKEFYAEKPDAGLIDRVLRYIEERHEAETVPLLKSVLFDLHEEFKSAGELEAKLHAAGLNKKTHLNIYQLTGIAALLAGRKMLLADEVGLGKTLQSICAFLASGALEATIIGPSVSLPRWMEDIGMHTDTPLDIYNLSNEAVDQALLDNPNIRVFTFATSEDRYRFFVTQRDPPEKGRRRVILMNNEVLDKMDAFRLHPPTGDPVRFVQKSIKEIKINNKKYKIPVWGYEPVPAGQPVPPQAKAEAALHTPFIIVDEAHMQKRLGGVRANALWGTKDGRQRGIEADWKILATATPIENDIKDLLAYLKYLARGETGPAERMFDEMTLEALEAMLREADPKTFSVIHAYLMRHMIRRRAEIVISGIPTNDEVTAWLNMREGTMTLEPGGDVIDLGETFVEQDTLYNLTRYPGQFKRDIVDKTPTALDTSTDDDWESSAAKNRRNMWRDQIGFDPGIFGLKTRSIKFAAVAALRKMERFQQHPYFLYFFDFVPGGRNLRRHIAETIWPPDVPKPMDDEEFLSTVAHIDGSVVDDPLDPDKAYRSKQIGRFQNMKVHDLGATIGSMGQSRQLTRAFQILFVTTPWTWSRFWQAIGRVIRRDPLRNWEGKNVTTLKLMIDRPDSIDIKKDEVRQMKAMLGDMIIDGNLRPQILATFSAMKEEERATEKPIDPLELNDYERSILEDFYYLLGQLLNAKDEHIIQDLLDRMAPLYAQILLRKASYFVNRAAWDYLSKLPRFQKGKKLEWVDAGSGPSTGETSYRAGRKLYDSRGFFVANTDLDMSAVAHRFGIPREGRQYVGALDRIGELAEAESKDGVRLSYAWRYIKDPIEFIKGTRRILKDESAPEEDDGGVLEVILPDRDLIDETFMENLQRAGFTPIVGEGGKIKADIPKDDYDNLVRMFGAEVAHDIRRLVRRTFTYLLVKKTHDPLPGWENLDFSVKRWEPPITLEKINRIRKSPGETPLVPPYVNIEGDADDAGVRLPPPDVSQFRRQLRAYRSLLKIVFDDVRRHAILSQRDVAQALGGENTILSQVDVKLQDHLSQLKGMILEPAVPLPPELRDELAAGLKELQATGMFRNNPLVPEMLKALSPMTTARTRKAISRLYAQKGMAEPSEWKKAWLAGRSEYGLTRRWQGGFQAWFTEHKPQSRAAVYGLGAGLALLWLSTLVVPAAAAWGILHLALPLLVKLPMAIISAAVAWWATERQTNILAHRMGNILAIIAQMITFPARRMAREIMREVRSEREQRKEALVMADRIAHLPLQWATATAYSMASSTHRLLSGPDAPSAGEISRALGRIMTSA